MKAERPSLHKVKAFNPLAEAINVETISQKGLINISCDKYTKKDFLRSKGLTNSELLNYVHTNNNESFLVLSKHCQQKGSHILLGVKLNKQ